jgi:hypothetical protein
MNLRDQVTELSARVDEIAKIQQGMFIDGMQDGTETSEAVNASTKMALETDTYLMRHIHTLEGLQHLNAIAILGLSAAMQKALTILGVEEDSIVLSDDEKEQMGVMMEMLDTSMARATEGLSGEVVAEKNSAFEQLLSMFGPASSDDGQMVTYDFGEDDDDDDDVENIFSDGDDPEVFVMEMDEDGRITVRSKGGADLRHALGDIFAAGLVDDNSVEEDTAEMFRTIREAQVQMETPTGAMPEGGPQTMGELLAALGIDLSNQTDETVEQARTKLVIDEDEEGIIRECVRLAMDQMEAGRIDANDLRILTAIFTGEGDLDEEDFAAMPAPGRVSNEIKNNLLNGQDTTIVGVEGKSDVLEILLAIYVCSMTKAGFIPSHEEMLRLIGKALTGTDD